MTLWLNKEREAGLIRDRANLIVILRPNGRRNAATYKPNGNMLKQLWYTIFIPDNKDAVHTFLRCANACCSGFLSSISKYHYGLGDKSDEACPQDAVKDTADRQGQARHFCSISSESIQSRLCKATREIN